MRDMIDNYFMLKQTWNSDAMQVSAIDKEADACKIITDLVGRGAKVDVPNVHGYTPLHKAAKAGNNAVAFTLVRCGADINLPNQKTQRSALADARTDALAKGLEEIAKENGPVRPSRQTTAP